ncbi:MAG: hypothetical protein USCGTAYLOR_02461 [Chromatiales bacterium USCg_Taylor]|nr:MAG: hypothetical protein USCGTAYLOR_02461 [Chromatiales bacterium USCg_Taylor]
MVAEHARSVLTDVAAKDVRCGVMFGAVFGSVRQSAGCRKEQARSPQIAVDLTFHGWHC